ncbi:MAG: hypothetical protein V4473_02665 [Patescibacteria group bacterium]
MKKGDYNETKVASTLLITGLVVLSLIFMYEQIRFRIQNSSKQKSDVIQFSPWSDAYDAGDVLYTGQIYHIFFHSLIIYPELANRDRAHKSLFEDYMITRDQFKKILPELYKNNFVLIDIDSIYSSNSDGTVQKKPIFLPKGKKPLILSIDDLSYYRSQQGDGFANKLVIDETGKVATEVITPEGKKIVTRDGDLVPILDDFVSSHPEFSIQGAKGVIAVTGFDGVLGYRTNTIRPLPYVDEATSAKRVIDVLKNTGWRFANHSYSHDPSFRNDTIALDVLKKDTEQWDAQVKPLVGDTHIYIGPFGQVFGPYDSRRQYLVSHGYTLLCGVGMDLYLQYFDKYIVMDRADIDGYRLTHTPELLKLYFDPEVILDQN